MNSKQIAVEYLAPKISNPAMIFKDIDILKSILPWAKDSAKEFFNTQPSKMFLTLYVDDIAPIVDGYITNRATEMYEKAIKSQNKLFSNLCSSQKTVAWIIDRWINTFINLTSNPNYKEYIDISKIKITFYNEISTPNSNLEDILEFEKLQKLPQKQIIKALAEIWQEAIYDFEFDIDDFEELCQKFNLNSMNVLGKDNLVKLNLRKEQTESGNSQLVLVF